MSVSRNSDVLGSPVIALVVPNTYVVSVQRLLDKMDPFWNDSVAKIYD